MNETEFIAFDLETTGLDPTQARIVEIGAVRFRGDGTVLGKFQQLVNPACQIPTCVIWIHGITNQMVAGAPDISGVLPRFLEFLGDRPVVMMAHNARFDLGFLSAALGRLGLAGPRHPVIDTCTLARCRLSLPDYKLETIGRHLRLIETEEHRALADAILLKNVFAHLIGKRPAITGTDELYALTVPLGFTKTGGAPDAPPAGYEGLWEAMEAGQPVEIKYLGGSTPGAIRLITPLEIKHARGQMYVSAYCHESRCDKTFRLDRIASFRRMK